MPTAFSLNRLTLVSLVTAAALVAPAADATAQREHHQPPPPPHDPAPHQPAPPAAGEPGDPAAAQQQTGQARDPHSDPAQYSLEDITETIRAINAAAAAEQARGGWTRERALHWHALRLKWGNAFASALAGRALPAPAPTSGGPTAGQYAGAIACELGRVGYELFRRWSPLATCRAVVAGQVRVVANVVYGNPPLQGVGDELTSEGIGLVLREQVTDVASLWQIQRGAGASKAEAAYVVAGVKLGRIVGFTQLYEAAEGITVHGDRLAGLDRLGRCGEGVAGLAGTMLGLRAALPPSLRGCATPLRVSSVGRPDGRHVVIAEAYDDTGVSIGRTPVVSGRAGARAVLGDRLPNVGRAHTEFTATVWGDRLGRTRVLRISAQKPPCPICFNRMVGYARRFDVLVVYEGPNGTVVFFPSARAFRLAGPGGSLLRALLPAAAAVLRPPDERPTGEPPRVCGTPWVGLPRPPRTLTRDSRPRRIAATVSHTTVVVHLIDRDGDGRPDALGIDYDGDGRVDEELDLRDGRRSADRDGDGRTDRGERSAPGRGCLIP